MHSPNIEQTMARLKSLPPERIAEVADFIDFLHQRRDPKPGAARHAPLNFPVDQISRWPEDLSLRREDMYGDEGR